MERGNKNLHFLDRFIGIPAVFLLGLLRRKRTPNIQVNRIAFFEGNAIGDTVLMYGVIMDIREKFPYAELIFFVGKTNYEIANLNKEINKLIKLPLGNPVKAIKLIRNEGEFDLFVDFMSWPRISALYSWFAKAKIKIGFRTPHQFRHFAYDIVVDHSDKIHEIDNFRALMKPMGVVASNLPRLERTGEAARSKSAVLHMFPSGFKSYLKKWPEENWKSIARFLLYKGYVVSISGGPGDREEGEKFSVDFEREGNFRNYAGKLSLQDTITILGDAQIVVSVNTGIMHIAAALRSNLVALHGPTSVLRWGPVSANSIAIQSPHVNAPCLNLGFEYKCGNDSCNCMALISVKEVIDKIEHLQNLGQ